MCEFCEVAAGDGKLSREQLDRVLETEIADLMHGIAAILEDAGVPYAKWPGAKDMVARLIRLAHMGFAIEAAKLGLVDVSVHPGTPMHEDEEDPGFVIAVAPRGEMAARLAAYREGLT